jgi:hypothetical protein
MTEEVDCLVIEAGAVLFGEYLRAMGVCGAIDHRLPRPGSVAGYNPSDATGDWLRRMGAGKGESEDGATTMA